MTSAVRDIFICDDGRRGGTDSYKKPSPVTYRVCTVVPPCLVGIVAFFVCRLVTWKTLFNFPFPSIYALFEAAMCLQFVCNVSVVCLQCVCGASASRYTVNYICRRLTV